MNEDISILIFEKDKNLKNILFEQLNSSLGNKVSVFDNFDNLLDFIKKNIVKVIVFNLDTISFDIKELIKILNITHEDTNLIIYYNKKLSFKKLNEENKIIYLPKPFRISTLLDYINKIINIKDNNLNIYLMDHLIFYPTQKIVKNLKSDKLKHFTETEAKLLNYLFQNRNSSIHKKELLSQIWKYNKNTDTHTLETHLYRLKQKLHSVETDLSFTFVNEKGKYYIRNIGDIK